MKSMFVYLLGAAVLAVSTSCVTQKGGPAPAESAAVEAKAEAKAAAKEKKSTAATVDSSRSQAINEISYDADAKSLTVVFDRGTYVYADVPADVYEALVNSESQGTYYRNEIRGKYKGTRQK